MSVLRAKQDGVERNSVILLEQVRTIDKQRLQARVTALSKVPKWQRWIEHWRYRSDSSSLPKPKTYNKKLSKRLDEKEALLMSVSQPVRSRV